MTYLNGLTSLTPSFQIDANMVKPICKAALIGIALLALAYTTHFCFELKPMSRNWREKNRKEVDPQVEKIMQILNRSEKFSQLLMEHRELIQKVHVHACTPDECHQYNVKTAACAYQPGSLFYLYSNESIDIYFNSSLPLIKQVRLVLIEFCNAICIRQFVLLDQLAKKGTLDRERYILFKEKTEWKATQPAFEIAEKIDNLNLLNNEKIFSLQEKRASQNCDFYLANQLASGHSERYGTIWDGIRNS